MKQSVWENRDSYIENSPFFFLDHVETPLLLVHGTADRGIREADSTFAALRRLRKRVEYAKYAGEPHYEGDWSLANRRDYVERMLAWFDEHLKTHPGKPALPE